MPEYHRLLLLLEQLIANLRPYSFSTRTMFKLSQDEISTRTISNLQSSTQDIEEPFDSGLNATVFRSLLCLC
jgi:hypothetical protein